MSGYEPHVSPSAPMSRRGVLAALGVGAFALAAGTVQVAAPPRRALAAATDFVFPRSSYEMLTAQDLQGLSAYDLYLARNEIFARHGYIFVSADLSARFGAMSWYTPQYTEATFSWDYLNHIEQCNIAVIQEQEALLRGEITGSLGDDAGRYTTAYFTFALPDYWVGYVDVLYNYEGTEVSVSYRGHPDQPLVWFNVVDSSAERHDGDIGTSLVAWWTNGRGQRIELWGRNYVYVSNIAGASVIAYPYPNAVVEAALVDLSTGGAWTVDAARVRYDGSSAGLTYYWDAIVPSVSIG